MNVQQYFRVSKYVAPPAGSPFISTWRTTNTSAGSSASNQIKLPTIAAGTYDFSVDWGDTNTDNITSWNQAEVTHTYASTGDYTITITGTCIGWMFSNTGDRLKIMDISQFGELQFNSNTNTSSGAFYGCSNLQITASEMPILLGSTVQFFRGCTSLTGNSSFNSWNTSLSANMRGMFQGCSNFNQPIGNWDVSNVTDMTNMFLQCTNFNQNIGGWDVGNVTSISTMFEQASSFNQNIGGWDVRNVTDMRNVFFSASSFNQNIGGWDVGNVTLMSQMFRNATAFNQNIGGWNVSAVTAFTGFMTGKTAANFSTTNLDAIYNGWSALTLNSGLNINFGTAKYTAGGSAGRAILTGSPNNWTITDGGI